MDNQINYNIAFGYKFVVLEKDKNSNECPL